MTIKLVDGYFPNHAKGHEWPRWNFPLLHNKRNVYGTNIELDKDDTVYALCSLYTWGQNGKYTHDHYHGKVSSDHMTFSSLR